ncbi:MAG: mechanosensitive ion channel [Gammaproteobacteria bacterium]|nr:mechanosensitive ion channel [Gammaproteobacteria bacterium]
MQLGVLIIAAAVAWLAHRRVHDYFNRLSTQTPLQQMLVHAVQILAFPLVMVAGVLIGRSILSHTHWKVAVLNISLPVLLSLAAIRSLMYLLQIALGPGRGLKTWENVIGTVIWALVALHLIGWLPEVLTWMDEIAFTVGQARVSVLTLCKLAASVAVWLLLALWIARVIESKLQQSLQLDAGTRLGLAKFSKVLLLTLAVFIALNSVGIDLTALTVFGGALGVGLGFGLQRIASNLISGFILVFERSIRPGDVITVGKSSGQVKELRARYIVVRSRDGMEILIPNENLIIAEVTNWTYSDRNVCVKVPVQISYHDDPTLAMRVMLDVARANPRVLAEPTPGCLLTAFAENGIDLELNVWINDPEDGIGNVHSEILLAVWHAFKQQHITFPCPQREIVIKAMPPREPLL